MKKLTWNVQALSVSCLRHNTLRCFKTPPETTNSVQQLISNFLELSKQRAFPSARARHEDFTSTSPDSFEIHEEAWRSLRMLAAVIGRLKRMAPWMGASITFPSPHLHMGKSETRISNVTVSHRQRERVAVFRSGWKHGGGSRTDGRRKIRGAYAPLVVLLQLLFGRIFSPNYEDARVAVYFCLRCMFCPVTAGGIIHFTFRHEFRDVQTPGDAFVPEFVSLGETVTGRYGRVVIAPLSAMELSGVRNRKVDVNFDIWCLIFRDRVHRVEL